MTVLFHPSRKKELLKQGQNLFNDEKYFEAHEVWEELWQVEQAQDKIFVQALIQIAAHLLHLKKNNFSAALSVLKLALQKLNIIPQQKFYQEFDLKPIFSALEYNKIILEGTKDFEQSSFLFPKLLEP